MDDNQITTKIILMYYNEGSPAIKPIRKKATGMKITVNDKDVRLLKGRSIFIYYILLFLLFIYIVWRNPDNYPDRFG